MLLSILIGLTIGAAIGAAIIGICECLKWASEIFDTEPATGKVEVIKNGSKVFDDVLKKNPRIRRAMHGEPTAVVLKYSNGLITSAGFVSDELSSEFDECAGYRINRRNREKAIAIKTRT